MHHDNEWTSLEANVATHYFLNGFVLVLVSFKLNDDRIGLSNGDELEGVEFEWVEVKEDIEELARFLCGTGGGARPGTGCLLGGGGGGGGFFPNEGCLAKEGPLCEWE